jgi:hypothetical protein
MARKCVAPIAAMASVEMRPMNHVSVRLRINCTALFSISGNARPATACRSTWRLPWASTRTAGTREERESEEATDMVRTARAVVAFAGALRCGREKESRGG